MAFVRSSPAVRNQGIQPSRSNQPSSQKQNHKTPHLCLFPAEMYIHTPLQIVDYTVAVVAATSQCTHAHTLYADSSVPVIIAGVSDPANVYLSMGKSSSGVRMPIPLSSCASPATDPWSLLLLLLGGGNGARPG